MKTSVSNLEDALAFELRSSYNGEQLLSGGIQGCIEELDSQQIRMVLEEYAESAGHKLLKLERIFSYLLQEPFGRKNEVIDKLLEATQRGTTCSCSTKIGDMLLLSSFRQIIQYKISVYKTALMIALELELEIVSDLLHQILEWERKADKTLKDLQLEALKRDEAIPS